MKNAELNKRLNVEAIEIPGNLAAINIDENGIITGWNRYAEKMFGFSVNEAIGKSIGIILPHELKDEKKKMIDEIRKEQINHYETVRKTKWGNKLFVAVTNSAEKDEDGKVTGLLQLANNITDKKLAEEKQAILAAIVNSSDDAIVSKTLDGIITSWNPAAIRMFGYTEKEAIGQHISIIIPPERIEEETVIINKLRSDEKMDHFETVRVAKDGTRINVSLTVSPIKNKNGDIIGASKVARDITIRKEAEKQRQLYTERLQELNQYKDEFMVMASHELKTPLTVILANLQILQLKMADNPDVSFINKSVKQVAKLSTLISNLLDVSKVQAGHLQLNPVTFDLSALIKEIKNNLQATAPGNHIIYHAPEEKLMVNADRERIDQVLTNLLGNAIKYSVKPSGIKVEAHRKEGHVVVSIEDKGIGIPENDLENIFNRFYRVKGLPGSYSGSGIGLYIASEIIKRHNGRIWVKSKLGEGSVFYFSIAAVEQ